MPNTSLKIFELKPPDDSYLHCMSLLKTNGAIKPCFRFFMANIMTKTGKNTHYMTNKMVTNGNKGKSIKFSGILMGFMLIKILLGTLPLNYVLIAIIIIQM